MARRKGDTPEEPQEKRYSTADVANMLGIRRQSLWEWIREGMFRPTSFTELPEGTETKRRKAWWSLRDVWEISIVAALRGQKLGLVSAWRALDALREYQGDLWSPPRHLVVIWVDMPGDEHGTQVAAVVPSIGVPKLQYRYRTIAVPLIEPTERSVFGVTGEQLGMHLHEAQWWQMQNAEPLVIDLSKPREERKEPDYE